MEHQLGDEAHDDSIRGRKECRLQLLVGRLQGRPRVHRRLHLPPHEKQGDKSATQRRDVPQTNRRMGLSQGFSTHGGVPRALKRLRNTVPRQTNKQDACF